MSIKIKNELKEVIIYGGLTMVKQRLTVGTKECISQYIMHVKMSIQLSIPTLSIQASLE